VDPLLNEPEAAALPVNQIAFWPTAAPGVKWQPMICAPAAPSRISRQT